MNFYKGDTVLAKQDKRGNKLEHLWGTELIGVTANFKSDGFVLFSRPMKTKIKLFLGIVI